MQSAFNPLTAAAVDYLADPRPSRRNDGSATWTTSSGEIGIFSDSDDIEDRAHFVDEYNRLAKKNGVRLLVKEDFNTCPQDADRTVGQERKSSWFRTLLREFSGSSHGSTRRHASLTQSIRRISSKRSLSDIASHLIHPKKDSLKDEDLQTLVRLCGKSKFYLPSDYAPGSLILPTCFRATAQYLVQHGTGTRGVFSVPGSAKVVSAIYDHYCPTRDEADMIDTTVSSPNLPSHFKASVQDVASAFKRFLAGLPGGILGSLTLFDAFVAIYSQVYAEPELNRTKQSKLRARLIALAIGTLKSQYRRELICAVFGLLSLIGRTAETAPREDEHGRPLPTSDLMGYKALGNVFGPLLVGSLLDSYSMKVADPNDGLILLLLSPPMTRRDRGRRKSKTGDETHRPPTEVDKIQVASSVAEMIITHWREVVKHLKSLNVLRTHKEMTAAERSQNLQKSLRPSASATFETRQPAKWQRSRPASVYTDTALQRRPTSSDVQGLVGPSSHAHEPLDVKRRRPKSGCTTANDSSADQTSRFVLSPTVEERGSPRPQAAGESNRLSPSTDKPLADITTASSGDPPSDGILLQTASPLNMAKSSSPSALRRKKVLKVGSKKGDKQRSGKGSYRADRVPLDTPTPLLSRHDSAWTDEEHAPPGTWPAGTNEHGIQPLVHNIQPHNTVRTRDWTRQQQEHGVHPLVEGALPSVAAMPTHTTPQQQPVTVLEDLEQPLVDIGRHDVKFPEQDVDPDPTVMTTDQSGRLSRDQGCTQGAQSPLVHPGELHGTPAELEQSPLTRYAHPGAFPASPTKETREEHFEPAQAEHAAEIQSYPFEPPCPDSKIIPEGRAKLTTEAESQAMPAGSTFTLGQSFRSTLDDASNSLVRGVSSAASALVDVFNPPSSGTTLPSKIPGLRRSLRRNLRPSKHRRLQKRRNLEISKTPSDYDEDGQSPAPNTQVTDTGAIENQSSPCLSAGLDEQGDTPQEGQATIPSRMQENVAAALESLTRDINATGERLLGTGFHPPRTSARRSPSTERSTVHDKTTRHNPAFAGLRADVTGSNGRRNDSNGSHEDGLGNGSVVHRPLKSSIPYNDGNQSFTTADTARDRRNTSATDDFIKKVALSGGRRIQPVTQTIEDGPGVASEPGAYHPSADCPQIETSDADTNHAVHDKTPFSSHNEDIGGTEPKRFIDVRPQRSVRRLSHIFKGMRRSSTTSNSTPTHQSSHISLAPSRHHFRRSSTSAASLSHTPAPQADAVVLGPGRMTPYRDPPPVASHLTRRLPPRSATPSMETLPAATATPTHGTNAALYKQVVTLQRQLAARTEEVAQLRRQLDALGEGGGAAAGTGALSERLRVAERDSRAWRERALAAERRVAVFERFLARVRRLREKREVEVEQGRVVGNEEGGVEDGGKGTGGEIEEEIEREMEALGGGGGGGGDEGEKGEEGKRTGQLDGTGKEWIWVAAATEVIEYDDERRWMNGAL